MPNVGGTTFHHVNQEGTPPSEQVEIITRAGVNGVAARLGGVRGKPFTLVCKKAVADAAAFDTLLDDCMALKTAVQTVVHSSGRTQTNVLVLEVEVRASGDGRASEDSSGVIAGGVGDAAGCTRWAVIVMRCIDTNTS